MSKKTKVIRLAGYEYNDEQMQTKLRQKLQDLGVEVVEIELDMQGVILAGSISHSFKQEFEEYTETYHFPISSLSDLLKYNEKDKDRRIKYGQDWLGDAEKNAITESDEIERAIEKAQNKLSKGRCIPQNG